MLKKQINAISSVSVQIEKETTYESYTFSSVQTEKGTTYDSYTFLFQNIAQIFSQYVPSIIFTLNIRKYASEKEQSEEGLHCLPFNQQFSDIVGGI